jgi:hypothetical protein
MTTKMIATTIASSSASVLQSNAHGHLWRHHRVCLRAVTLLLAFVAAARRSNDPSHPWLRLDCPLALVVVVMKMMMMIIMLVHRRSPPLVGALLPEKTTRRT